MLLASGADSVTVAKRFELAGPGGVRFADVAALICLSAIDVEFAEVDPEVEAPETGG